MNNDNSYCKSILSHKKFGKLNKHQYRSKTDLSSNQTNHWPLPDQKCFLQNVKKIKKFGSISGFTCDNCKEEKCCWSTSGRCPCMLDVEHNGTQFCAGCEDALTNTGTVRRNIMELIHILDYENQKLSA